MWCYFYVLQSQKDLNWFYKGVTYNLEHRLDKHNDGLVLSTKSHAPFILVYYEAYLNELAAKLRERGVKKSGSVWMPLMKRVKASLNYKKAPVKSRLRKSCKY